MVAAGGGRISVSVTPSVASGSGPDSTVQTNIVTATASPSGSYSYLWSYVSGDADISPNFALNSQFQRWTGTGLIPSEDRLALWRMTVSIGSVVVASVDINVTVERTA